MHIFYHLAVLPGHSPDAQGASPGHLRPWLLLETLNGHSTPTQGVQDPQRLVATVRWTYWTQLTLVLVLFITLVGPLGFWPAFCAATMHPLSRFPLFAMGMAAGELHVRSPAVAMPWLSCVAFHLYPCQCCCGVRNVISRSQLPDDTEYWRYRATSQSLRLLVMTALVIFGSVAAPVNDPLGAFVAKGGCVWYQAIVPFAQLEVIVGLVRDRGTSWAGQVSTNQIWPYTSRHLWPTPLVTRRLSTPRFGRWRQFLRMSGVRYLGKLSMNIYLMQWVALQYTVWALNGWRALEWPRDPPCEQVHATRWPRTRTDGHSSHPSLTLCAVPSTRTARTAAWRATWRWPSSCAPSSCRRSTSPPCWP